MPYLRMLTNALVGGALVGAFLVVLVLQLNPAVPLGGATVPAAAAIGVFYGLQAAVIFYAIVVLRRLVAPEMRSPGWLSLRLLAQFGAVAACGAAAVTWLNIGSFGVVLGPTAVGAMRAAAWALTLCAAACVILLAVQLPLVRGRRLVGWLFAAVMLAAFGVPLAIRQRSGPLEPRGAPRDMAGISQVTPAARVQLILLDGASLDFIAPAAAGGRVPNFGRIIESGAVLHLATIRPTQPASVWSAVATGKLPFKTRIYSAAQYLAPGSAQPLDVLPDFCFAQSMLRVGLLTEREHDSEAVAARPLWELLNRFGIRTGVVGWPVTYPARPVDGYLVTEQLVRMPGRTPPELARNAALAWPPDALDIALRAGAAIPAGTFAVDSFVERTAGELARRFPVMFTAVRYPGLDAVGHYYLRYAVPRAFGDVSDDERGRFGRVLERYYTYVDGIVGRAIQSLGADDLLLVVSGFGMDPLGPGKRALERIAGDPKLSGTHENAPDGFLMAYGRSVAPGAFPRASVVDVAPTILYFLGLPVARDMDGYARTDIFTAGFTDQRPITFIPSVQTADLDRRVPYRPSPFPTSAILQMSL